MTSLKTILYATITASFLFPYGVVAQDLEEEGEELAPVYASEIEIGIGVNTEDNFKFGKFNGLDDDGAYFIGNLDVRKARVAGDDSKDYWELSGRDLGLDTRSIYGEYTQEGLFSIYLDYDEKVNNLIDDGRTPFSGSGSERLTLPANWVPGSGVGSLPQLIPSLQNITIQKDRQKIGGGLRWKLSDLWEITGSYHHEDKDGTDEFGAIFGTSGGTPRGSIVAIPHNFDFDEFSTGIVYKGNKGQFVLNYSLSLFDNNITSLVFDNPYNLNRWHVASRSAVGALVQGQVGNIFPDNEAWSVNFSGGYNLSRKTRMTANVTYGEMTQDQAFLPYSIIPALQATITTPLPRANLDGKIENTFVNLNLTHRFNNKLDAKARFTYDDRDNVTPINTYVRINGDGQAQPAFDPANGIVTGNARVNRPYSYENIKFELDAGYRLLPRTKLSAGYKYEEKDRDLQEVATTKEHGFHVKLNTTPTDWMSAWAKYSYATRDGGGNDVPQFLLDVFAVAQAQIGPLDPLAVDVSNYFGNNPHLVGHAPEYIAAEVAAFLANPTGPNLHALYENDPYIRKFYMADRDKKYFTVNANFYPNEEVSLSVYGKYANDEYDNSPTGLQESKRGSLTFDAVYSPSDAFSANAYFTVEKNDYEQRGFEHAGNQNLNPTNVDRLADIGFNFWRVFSEDSIYTAGAGFEWEVIKDKFDLSLDFTYSDATTDITPLAEIEATPTRLPADIPFPDVESRLFSIKLKGDYKLKEGWGSRVYYWYERYDSTDFALDSIETNTLARGGTGGNVILLGNKPPTYNAHVIGFTLYREF